MSSPRAFISWVQSSREEKLQVEGGAVKHYNFW